MTLADLEEKARRIADGEGDAVAGVVADLVSLLRRSPAGNELEAASVDALKERLRMALDRETELEAKLRDALRPVSWDCECDSFKRRLSFAAKLEAQQATEIERLTDALRYCRAEAKQHGKTPKAWAPAVVDRIDAALREGSYAPRGDGHPTCHGCDVGSASNGPSHVNDARCAFFPRADRPLNPRDAGDRPT